MKHLFASAVLAAILPAAAPAAITINVDQVGTSVVLTGSGSFNTTGLGTYASNLQGGGVVNAAPGIVSTGTPASITLLTTLTGPSLGFLQSIKRADLTGGDAFGVNQNLGAVYLPQGYVSGTQLAGTSTYLNATFASLGLSAGQYVFRAPADTLTLNIGLAAAVPEPATWTTMLAGFALVGTALRVGRRRVKVRFG